MDQETKCRHLLATCTTIVISRLRRLCGGLMGRRPLLRQLLRRLLQLLLRLALPQPPLILRLALEHPVRVALEELLLVELWRIQSGIYGTELYVGVRGVYKDNDPRIRARC